MSINYYSYEELARKALSAEATQEDVNSLGEWFSSFGSDYWNGECYAIDNAHSLFPVYVQVAEDEYEIANYEIR